MYLYIFFKHIWLLLSTNNHLKAKKPTLKKSCILKTKISRLMQIVGPIQFFERLSDLYPNYYNFSCGYVIFLKQKYIYIYIYIYKIGGGAGGQGGRVKY